MCDLKKIIFLFKSDIAHGIQEIYTLCEHNEPCFFCSKNGLNSIYLLVYIGDCSYCTTCQESSSEDQLLMPKAIWRSLSLMVLCLTEANRKRSLRCVHKNPAGLGDVTYRSARPVSLRFEPRWLMDLLSGKGGGISFSFVCCC